MNEQILKPSQTNTEERIINTLITLKGNGLKECTIKCIGYKLSRLKQESNLDNPEQIRNFIANALDKKTKKPLTPASRNKFADAYDHYCKINGIQWNKPFYKVAENTPLIPTPQNVQAIIDNASQNYATIFTLEAEIGCSPEELHLVTQKNIDKEKGEISITGVKGHDSKTYKLKKHLAEMLNNYLAKHPEEHPFPKAHSQCQMWQKYRARASKKLCKPELLKIQLRNLRNYSGERFYKNLPIRDPILVMQHLRHKKLETTMHYLRAIVLDYEEDDQWISRTSTTIEEDAKLIENGFQYVTERDETKLFKKRK